jgi:hypothetical protein
MSKKSSTPKQPKNLYLVIQQGGSSTEMYVHPHNSLKEAKADKKSCAKASYNTSEPIVIPESLSGLITAMNKDTEGELWELLETVARNAAELV